MHIAGHIDNSVSGIDPYTETSKYPRLQNIGLLNNLTDDEFRYMSLLSQQRKDEDQNNQMIPPPPPEKKSIFKKLGEKLTDPVVLTGLATAFDSMTTNPSPQLQQRYAAMQQAQRQNQYANQTVQYLKSQGEDKLADIVATNPTVAKEVLTTFAKSTAGTNFAPETIGGVQIDPITGQKYVFKFNKNTNQVTRFDVPDAIGDTPDDTLKDQIDLAKTTGLLKMSQEAGKDALKKVSSLDQQLNLYNSALINIQAALDKKQDPTGIFRNIVPAFTKEVASLRAIQAQLGINVLNSATFGALSKPELELALSTPIDLKLEPDELVPYINDRIAASTKLRDELSRRASFLLGTGTTDELVMIDRRRNAIDKEADKFEGWKGLTYTNKQGIQTAYTKEFWDSHTLQQKVALMPNSKLKTAYLKDLEKFGLY